MNIKAMKHALEVLDESEQHYGSDNALREAIQTLRAAIAEASMQRLTDVQQAMEAPRVNQCAEVCERAKLCAICARGLEEMEQKPAIYPEEARELGLEEIPYYSHPPRREWVGLTDEDHEAFCKRSNLHPVVAQALAEYLEANLKERNT